MANIALNDATILPYHANPEWMEFSERTPFNVLLLPLFRDARQGHEAFAIIAEGYAKLAMIGITVSQSPRPKSCIGDIIGCAKDVG